MHPALRFTFDLVRLYLQAQQEQRRAVAGGPGRATNVVAMEQRDDGTWTRAEA